MTEQPNQPQQSAPVAGTPVPAAGAAAQPQPEAFIEIDDFAKVVLKTGEVIAAENHPNADKLLKLTVKVGDETRTICAGIRQWWQPEQLVGKTIIVAANLKPRMMRGVESQGMMLAVSDATNGVSPLTTIKPVASGLRVS